MSSEEGLDLRRLIGLDHDLILSGLFGDLNDVTHLAVDGNGEFDGREGDGFLIVSWPLLIGDGVFVTKE